MDEKQLQRAMQLIAIAGNAKSEAIQSMQFADDGDFEKSDNMLEKAQTDLHQAHEIQTKWMSAEMGGEKVEKSLLLIHSQDHFMSADIMINVAKQTNSQAKRIKVLEAKINE